MSALGSFILLFTVFYASSLKYSVLWVHLQTTFFCWFLRFWEISLCRCISNKKKTAVFHYLTEYYNCIHYNISLTEYSNKTFMTFSLKEIFKKLLCSPLTVIVWTQISWIISQNILFWFPQKKKSYRLCRIIWWINTIGLPSCLFVCFANIKKQ